MLRIIPGFVKITKSLIREIQIFLTPLFASTFNNNFVNCTHASASLVRVSSLQLLVSIPFYYTIVETTVTWILLVNSNTRSFLTIPDMRSKSSILLTALFYDNTKNHVLIPQLSNKYYKQCTNSVAIQLWIYLVVSSFK